MQTYPTPGAAYLAGAKDLVPIVSHATARAAYRRAVAAAEAIPEAQNRKRHSAKAEAIAAYLMPRYKYADAVEVAEAIAGKQVHYIHRHTVNIGTRRWSDYRPEYEEFRGSIILKGTASKTGKSVDRIHTIHLTIVQG